MKYKDFFWNGYKDLNILLLNYGFYKIFRDYNIKYSQPPYLELIIS